MRTVDDVQSYMAQVNAELAKASLDTWDDTTALYREVTEPPVDFTSRLVTADELPPSKPRAYMGAEPFEPPHRPEFHYHTYPFETELDTTMYGLLQKIDNARTHDEVSAVAREFRPYQATCGEAWVTRITMQGKAKRKRLNLPEYPPERVYPLLIPDPKNIKE